MDYVAELTPKEKLLELEKEAYGNYYPTPKNFLKEIKDEENQNEERVLDNFKKMLNSKDFDEAKHQLEILKTERKISVPTPYQNPGSYRLLLELSDIVEKGFSTCQFIHKKTGKNTMLKDLGLNFVRPTLGTIHFGSINAYTYPCDNKDYLIVFEMELSTFCFLLCKVIVQALPAYDPTFTNFQMYSDKINEEINKNPEIAKRFEELIIAFITSGRATLAPQYVLHPKFYDLLSHLCQAMETFVVAHEYSHILLGHVDNLRYSNSKPNNLKDIMFSWEDESNADGLGVPLMIEGLRTVGYQSENVSYCGAESYFSGYEILERAKCLIQTGNDEWYWKECCKEDGSLGLHPPSHTRRESLRNQMREIYGEKFLTISKIVETIIKTLWEKTKPNLIKNRKELYIKLLSYQVETNCSKKKYSVALDLLDKILELDNRYLPALFGKGNIFQELRKFKEANQYYDSILKIDKDDIGALVQKANVSFAKKDYKESLEFANSALEKDSMNTHALYAKGKMLVHLDKFEEAIQCFNLILKLDKNNILALLGIAFAYSLMMKLENAIIYYDKVLEIDPYNRDAFEYKFMLLRKLENFDEALKMVDNFLKETPDDTDLLEIKEELEKEKHKKL